MAMVCQRLGKERGERWEQHLLVAIVNGQVRTREPGGVGPELALRCQSRGADCAAFRGLLE